MPHSSILPVFKGADVQESLIRPNFFALTRLSIAALAGFRKTGIGTLVNIASVIAFAPSAAGATYSGSKAFVLNFTRSLQLEYEKTDIRRSEEHTSELQSPMRIPYAVFCLKKKQ